MKFLRQVLNATQSVMGDEDVFQYEVNEVLDALTQALQEFKDSVNKDPAILEIAAGITSIETPTNDMTSLTLPTVPEGYTVAIKSTNKPNVVRMDGTIVPQAAQTTVTLVLEVTRTSDGMTAETGSIPVVIPATPTAGVPLVSMTDGPTTIYGSSVVQLQTSINEPAWSVTEPDGSETTDATINAFGFLYATKEGTYKVAAGNEESILITFSNMTLVPNLII